MEAGKTKRKPLEVVAGYIKEGNRFLLFRRPPYKARGLGWEFAGGKIEKGETGQQALKRELREEINADVTVYDEMAECYHDYDDLSIHLTLYQCTLSKTGFSLNEHVDCRWVTLEETDEMSLCPADKILVEMLKRKSELL